MFDWKENGQTDANWAHFAQGRCFWGHDNEPSGLKKNRGFLN